MIGKFIQYEPEHGTPASPLLGRILDVIIDNTSTRYLVGKVEQTDLAFDADKYDLQAHTYHQVLIVKPFHVRKVYDNFVQLHSYHQQ